MHILAHLLTQGLDRAAWTASHFTDAQLSNGGVSISTVIPTLDSISIASVPDGAIMHLQNMNSPQAIMEDKPQLPPQEGQQDDLSLLQHLLPQSFDPQRPNSLAVPWMTTSGNSSSNPVIYVSPEATYMSKIIPNAILPPSVDVVELSRNRSRSSVRMVSKSSLASASPAPSRASSRASSRLSSRAPSLISSRLSSRASTHRTATLSECSSWSRSGSSETLVSDSSTISSSSTPRVASRISQAENTGGPCVVKDNSHAPNTLFKPVQLNGNNQQKETWKKSGSTDPFNRSLSVTKKSKKPPPPPSRSHSLHSRMYARTVAEHKSLENGSQYVESPYSAYTSHNANTVVPSTENLTSQRAVLAELQNRKKSLQTHTGNTPYSHTNGGSHRNNLKHFLPSIKSLTANGVVASPAVTTLIKLLDVPDPPKVLAPPPPPPETWAHNECTFELLCGPGPVNFERWAQKRGLKIEVPVHLTQGKMSATSQATNLMKEDIVAPKMQTQEAIGSDMQYRTPKVSTDVHPPYGNTLPLPRLNHVRPSPSPSPPPEHIPPMPPTDQVNSLEEDASAQFQGPSDEVICPPPHPLFPPPPPPTKVPPPHQPSRQDEIDYQSPPMPLSLKLLFKVSPVPQDPQPSTSEEGEAEKIPPPPQKIPPAPPMIPPAPPIIPPAPPVIPPSTPPMPPPPPAIPPPPTSRTPPPPVIPPPPPLIAPSPKADTTPPKQAQIISTPFNVPLPPPLPMDIKKEVKAIEAEIQQKQPSPPTTHTVVTTEESTPMVTPSLLQKVRLRSIRSNVNPAETPGGLPRPKHQTNQEAPQKPIRRSLILITPDLPSQLATDQKDDTLPSTTLQENKDTTPPSDNQPKAEPNVLSVSAEQVSPDRKHGKMESNSQVSITDQQTQQASTEPIKESVPAEPVPHIPNKAEPKPKITVQESQNVTPESSTMPAPAEPKEQPIANDIKGIQNDFSNPEDKQSPPLVQPKQDVKLPKPQPLIPTSPKFNPAQKAPPTMISSSSMSLQEAIRLKTSAMSSTDNQAKRRSLLHSPPLSAGAVSPTSTANFIFSKSTKKVVIEKSPSSPESKSDLRKTLVSELNSVSQTSKPSADSRNTKAKVPPPVAKKPTAKSENITHNSSESNVDTEHVQTAGQ